MCCDKPCLIPQWLNGVFGYFCLNCTQWRQG